MTGTWGGKRPKVRKGKESCNVWRTLRRQVSQEFKVQIVVQIENSQGVWGTWVKVGPGDGTRVIKVGLDGSYDGPNLFCNLPRIDRCTSC